MQKISCVTYFIVVAKCAPTGWSNKMSAPAHRMQLYLMKGDSCTPILSHSRFWNDRYKYPLALRYKIVVLTEWVSSFLTAHQHILGYLVPYDGEKVIKMWRYNQGYLATTNVK